MEGWSLELDWPHDEPTYVPTVDECQHAARGDNCGHTDCPECGREASAQLRAEALLSTAGVIRLAREVVRIQEYYGNARLDGYEATVGDLSLCRRTQCEAVLALPNRSRAWAEGVIDALCGNAWLQPCDYGSDPDERWAYMVGRILVELYSMREWLRGMEAQAYA